MYTGTMILMIMGTVCSLVAFRSVGLVREGGALKSKHSFFAAAAVVIGLALGGAALTNEYLIRNVAGKDLPATAQALQEAARLPSHIAAAQGHTIGMLETLFGFNRGLAAGLIASVCVSAIAGWLFGRARKDHS